MPIVRDSKLRPLASVVREWGLIPMLIKVFVGGDNESSQAETVPTHGGMEAKEGDEQTPILSATNVKPIRSPI